MGALISVDIPSQRSLRKMSREGEMRSEDYYTLRDKLKPVALHEGGISKRDWRKACKSVGIQDKVFVDYFFELFDESGDGWIDWNEFAVYCALVAKEDRKKKIEYVYRVFDTESSQYLDVEQLQRAFLAVTRTIMRVNFALPGLIGDDARPGQFTIHKREEAKICRAAEKMFAKLPRKDEDRLHYKECQKGDKAEVAEILDYFVALQSHLPKGSSTKKKRRSSSGTASSEDSFTSLSGVDFLEYQVYLEAFMIDGHIGDPELRRIEEKRKAKNLTHRHHLAVLHELGKTEQDFLDCLEASGSRSSAKERKSKSSKGSKSKSSKSKGSKSKSSKSKGSKSSKSSKSKGSKSSKSKGSKSSKSKGSKSSKRSK